MKIKIEDELFLTWLAGERPSVQGEYIVYS